MAKKDAWIQTASGLRVSLLDPDPQTIVIEDIAHALAMLCRFNGHCLQFYSVAEHSVHVSKEIAHRLALLGLMHDAAEAYLGDVPSPLKKRLRSFERYEKQFMLVLAEKFGFADSLANAEDYAELKRADIQLLVDEKAVLMAKEPAPWPYPRPPPEDPGRIRAWSPTDGERGVPSPIS